LSISIGMGLNFLLSKLFKIDLAEMIDISYSTDFPPKITAIFFVFGNIFSLRLIFK
jgi:hypothetical protein